MSTPQLDRLREHCHQLRLYQIEQELTARLEQAAKKEISYADFLDQLLACEVDAKTHKHHQMRIAMARFPYQKTLESFDFKFQPSIDPKQIRELASGRYIQSGDNLLLLSPPGVGKSHLAIALGIKACEQGVRTLFVTATALITTLGKALAEGKLDERLKLLTQPQLLICDEIGYLPIDRHGANLFFQLVSRPLRAWFDHHHQQPEPRCLGRGLRRYRDRQRDPRPPASSFDHHQHQRRKLQA